MKISTLFLAALTCFSVNASQAAEGPISVNLFLGVDQPTDLNTKPGLYSVRVQLLKSDEVKLDSGYGYQLQSYFERHLAALAKFRLSPFSHVYVNLPAYCHRVSDHAMINVFASEADRAEYVQAAKEKRSSRARVVTTAFFYGNGTDDVEGKVCLSLN